MGVSIESSEKLGPFRVHFADASPSQPKSPPTFSITVPVLAGLADEEIFPNVLTRSSESEWSLFQSGELLIGCASALLGTTDLEANTRRLYQRMLQTVGDRFLYRIWNYVPQINTVVMGLEHYRSFCRARSLVFESAWGPGYKTRLPAASAVGAEGDRIFVVFVAGRIQPVHQENPEQIPAYEYPEEHGPRPPSFARATAARADGLDYLFISGTSAIKGHSTIAPGSLTDQVACTIDNLRLVSEASGAGSDLGASQGWKRHFKIYLRKAADLLPARALLEGPLLRPEDKVTWLRADICRAPLHIEIEVTLLRPSPAVP